MSIRSRIETFLALQRTRQPGAASKVITVRMSRELFDKLTDTCGREQLSKNRLVTLAIEDSLAALAPPQAAETDSESAAS